MIIFVYLEMMIQLYFRFIYYAKNGAAIREEECQGLPWLPNYVILQCWRLLSILPQIFNSRYLCLVHVRRMSE